MIILSTYKKQRIAIYARVSTTEQSEEGYSISAQQETIRDYCEQHGYEVVDTYVDAGISGKSIKKRLELQRLLADVDTDKFDRVMVWKISRMARNMTDLMKIVDVFQANNITFYSISERFELNTSTGKFMLQVMASVNEYERNIIAENVKLGMTKRARDGLWNGNQLLGYRNEVDDKGKGIIVIEPKEALIITRIFTMYQKKHGYRAIANRLNRLGLVTKRGNSFSTVAVKDILNNPTYVGIIRYNRYENWADKGRKGKSDAVIESKGQHEAIIDQSLWDAVHARMAVQSSQPAWNRKGSNVLTGLLRCPQCGSPMAASNVTNRLKDGTKKRLRYYSCSQFRNKGASVCSANSIRADDAERRVKDTFIAYINQPELMRGLSDSLGQRQEEIVNEWEQEKRQLETTHIQKTKEFDELLAIISRTPDLKTDLASRIRELKIALGTLSQQREQIQKKLDKKEEPLELQTLEQLMKFLNGLLHNQGKKELKGLYQLLIDRIDWRKETNELKIYFKLDDIARNYIKEHPEAASQVEAASLLWLRKTVLPLQITFISDRSYQLSKKERLSCAI